MKKQLFLSLFLFVITSLLWAQTDMTDRIVNPGFEDEINGWEIRKMSRQGNNEFPLKVGVRQETRHRMVVLNRYLPNYLQVLIQ